MNICKESLVYYMVEYDCGFYSRDKNKTYSMDNAELFKSLLDAMSVADDVKGDVRKVKIVDIGSAN